jgi:two-component system sensor histidine kinase SenX3
VVEQAISMNQALATKSNISLAMSAKTGALVLGDRSSLVTAVHNLIRNAITYSTGPSRVGVGAVVKAGVVEVSITDQGLGIAQSDLERVFERFYRSDPARSRDTGGTGLGLAIVKHVVNNHQGEVRVWSQVGKGSTFTIRLREATAEQIAEREEELARGELVRSAEQSRPAEYLATDEIPIVFPEDQPEVKNTA